MFLETNLWGKIINTHVSILSSSLVHSYFRGPWFVLIQIYTPCECFVQGWNLSNLFLRRFFLHVNPNIFSRFLQISLKEDMPLFLYPNEFWYVPSLVKKLSGSREEVEQIKSYRPLHRQTTHKIWSDKVSLCFKHI